MAGPRRRYDLSVAKPPNPDPDDGPFTETIPVPGSSPLSSTAKGKKHRSIGPKHRPTPPSDIAGVSRLMRELGVTPPPTLPPELTAWERLEDDGDTGRLGRYSLQGILGEGGMGVVTEALDTELRRPVALKTLNDPDGAGRSQLARFVAEARITSQLDHPNIVPVHDLGVSEDGQLYFVMKRVRGRSLKEILSDLRAGNPDALLAWPSHRLLNAFLKVCEAVAYAHGRGVIHRDIKPANIMLGEYGEVLVMDWGIARVLDGAEEVTLRDDTTSPVSVSRTLDGSIIGTPGWMAPEQARGLLKKIDERSDVWSLGAILYAVLTFRAPYQDKDPMQLLYKAAKGPPEDPRERAPEFAIEPTLAELCLSALSTDRDSRPMNAGALAAELEAVLAGHHAAAENTKRWRQFGWVAAVVAAMGLLVVGNWAHLRQDVVTSEEERASADHAAEVSALLAEGRRFELDGHPTKAAALYRAASSLQGDDSSRSDLQRVLGIEALRRNLSFGTSPASHLLWVSKSRIAVAYDDGTIISWDISTGGPEVLARGNPVRGLVLTGEEATFAACGEGSRARVWQSGTGVPLGMRDIPACSQVGGGLVSMFGSPTSLVQTTHVSPDGEHMAVPRADRGVDLWTRGSEVKLQAEAEKEGIDTYIGTRNNYRVCRTTRAVVPLVPYPPVADVWARKDACDPPDGPR